jgi:hypothetical protein
LYRGSWSAKLDAIAARHRKPRSLQPDGWRSAARARPVREPAVRTRPEEPRKRDAAGIFNVVMMYELA